eukprot:TRINITY_DN20650_c0_g1_i1.p1 TRINITY_DN20650_c0_g1~~TRINITY_DN20650_c0_g1_i1.p1  ORF type:complete len:128 (-),score=13.43 TRINITY_DN20650_c0_g1_i1:110-469(-)
MGKGQPVRLYQPATFTGFKRSRHLQTMHTAILKIDNVNTQSDARFYAGKRVAYIYRATKNKAPTVRRPGKPKTTKFRVIWGKVCRPHGSSGSVRAKFAHNLPARAIGARLRVMLYPSNI